MNSRNINSRRRGLLPRRRQPVRRLGVPRPLNDPRAMVTVAGRGPLDPPQTSLGFVGTKRFRQAVQLVAGSYTATFTTISSCLPLITPVFRILKASFWAPAAADSFVRVNFPTGQIGGDSNTWTDEGTQGSIRPQLHLIPNFASRNTWINAGTVAIIQGNGTDTIIIDWTLEYRTTVQTCPADFRFLTESGCTSIEGDAGATCSQLE